jgi:predicted membrane channel-forming protein YqfA (hemolysin III family)
MSTDKELLVKANKLITLSYVLMGLSVVSFLAGMWFGASLGIWTLLVWGFIVLSALGAKWSANRANDIANELAIKYLKDP